MDVIQSENIKVPNSVLVSGLSGTDVDDEVVEFLERYGSVERVVKIDSSDANFKNKAFQSFNLAQLFNNSRVTYHVTGLLS